MFQFLSLSTLSLYSELTYLHIDKQFYRKEDYKMAKLFSTVTPEEMVDSPSLSIKLPELNFGSLSDGKGGLSLKLNAPPPENSKKKTTKRSTKKTSASTGVVTDTVTQRDDMITTNKPYETKYQETTGMLKMAIGQLDGLLTETISDANMVRASRTLKRKYDLLSLLNSNASNIIGNKISAIREINNSISKCNDLELKRMKELNLAASAEDSDKKIMDMYQAFISMPVGDGMNMEGPNLQSVANSLSTGNVITGTTIGEDDAAYQSYLANMNPSQRLNMYESNPNVKQVVVYDQQTGARYFEVMDVSTGEVIPGVDKHDSMFLEGVTLDLEHKIARNIDLGESYPIVVVGEPVMNMY